MPQAAAQQCPGNAKHKISFKITTNSSSLAKAHAYLALCTWQGDVIYVAVTHDYSHVKLSR